MQMGSVFHVMGESTGDIRNSQREQERKQNGFKDFLSADGRKDDACVSGCHMFRKCISETDIPGILQLNQNGADFSDRHSERDRVDFVGRCGTIGDSQKPHMIVIHIDKL